MREYDYEHVDVFTQSVTGGNPLAVITDADGLSSAQMQQIAREFNFSESAFVLPTDRDSCAVRVRIFTPTREVPFAGHPNIGTAWVLAQTGRFGDIDRPIETAFDEAAGTVAITIERTQTTAKEVLCVTLRAPAPFSRGASLPIAQVAAALSLTDDAIDTSTHAPCIASVGLPFTVVALRDAQALASAQVNVEALRFAEAKGVNPDVYCYVRDGQRVDARMFAPFDGVPEDPATGSATCAAAGLLATSMKLSGDYDWQFTQGVAMGRPSQLQARTRSDANGVSDVWLSGYCARFATGTLSI
ncbi:MAG: PhzF family phenazine biosynthesis protein [Pseudomonadota bacterium]